MLVIRKILERENAANCELGDAALAYREVFDISHLVLQADGGTYGLKQNPQIIPN